MDTLTRPERLALLVSLLGDEAKDAARAGMDQESLADFDESLDDFRDYPPSKEEIDSVLDYFNAFFELAIDSAANDEDGENGPTGSGVNKDGSPKLGIFQVSEEQFDLDLEPTRLFDKIELSGDSMVDINRLHPYQVARAIRNENIGIMMVVIRKLSDQHAAKTVEFLPEAVRPKIILEFSRPARVKPIIEECILQATLDAAMTVEKREEEEESSDKIAKLLRSLPRLIRSAMLEELFEKNPELGEEVKSKCYLFEDLEKLESRDLQKLLAQCKTDSLVVALQGVDEELLANVLENMSKRAKETLQEEMEFKTNAREDEIELGRKEIVKLLIKLVESGEVTID